MKKVLCAVLALMLLLGLAACGGSASVPQTDAAPGTDDTTGEAKGPGVFQAGFAAVDVTPQEPVPMNGYSSSKDRISTGFQSYLYAMAMAATDSQGNTLVVISVDSCTIETPFNDQIRAWVEETCGIPKSNVILSAIHQHSCVDLESSLPAAVRYREQMIKGIQQAVTQALEDRAPAKVLINSVQTESLAFVKHYWTKEGTMYGDNYGTKGSGLVSHESDADPEMRLVKFQREGKKDILIVNFQAHPHMGDSQKNTLLSANWPGIMRETVAKKLDINCMYFSGAGGNLNSTSQITSENISKDYKEHGQRAAQYVVDAEAGYREVSGDRIRGVDLTATYDVDHSMDRLYSQAYQVNSMRSKDAEAAKAMLKDYPELHSIYHATAVVAKYDLPATRKLTVTAVTMGDVVFAGFPYEMFDTNGMELRGGTVGNPNYSAEEQLQNPFAMTVIATKANGNHGYIPSAMNYKNGGYSVDITKFAAGTGERVVGSLLKTFQELHG